MDDRQIKLVIGSLLHDIGKVVYRSGDGNNHSTSGYEFLQNLQITVDKEILDCVRYHHGAWLKGAGLESDALAYITYYADNVASAMDRRESMDSEDGFDREVPLASVFNILNGNDGHMHYAHQVMNPKGQINYPTDRDVTMDPSFYTGIIARIQDNLNGIELSEEYINSLLSVLEANLQYIPSSTSKRELADISLYDHVKMTAAIAECLYQYLAEQQDTNYRQAFYSEEASKMWDTEAFLLYSMDISGIQKFIYTISSKGALKGLRARSFYLEILMQHIVDDLLGALQLSRSCLIYSGGGHCYMLLPNTNRARQITADKNSTYNRWFMQQFGTDLYVADGAASCSANNLRNEPEGSYRELFLTVSRQISMQKGHRYSAEEIQLLNRSHTSGKRECIICRRSASVDADGRCPICGSLEHLSADILHQDYFAVMLEPIGDALPLPGGAYLTAGNRDQLLRLMDRDTYVRSYTKNDIYTGKHVTTKLFVGNYATGDTFEQFAHKAAGIDRIAVLRADVDNLGNTFVNGFHREKEGGRYETLSRTATLSRQLSMFFQCYINRLLQEGQSSTVSEGGSRQLCIVYSGGDDVFLVGAWNDVIDAFIDIRSGLQRYTQGTLTISGGVGIYNSSYPINRMASETADLEDYAKANPDGCKNSITLFDETGRYSWPIFIEQVLGEKYTAIRSYMDVTQMRGKAFLYHLLELLRDDHPRFNRARYVYYLSRLEPARDDPQAERDAYCQFRQCMLEWSMESENRRQLVTAIYLYVYRARDKEDEQG